jgi:hypothetical protein
MKFEIFYKENAGRRASFSKAKKAKQLNLP